MNPIENIVSRLAEFSSHRYILEFYNVGHKQLVIATYPKEHGSGIFINFGTVEYVQLPTYWQEATLCLATPNECQDFLSSIGIEVFNHMPYLFYAHLPKSTVRIVCHSVRLSEINPYDEIRAEMAKRKN